MSAKVLIVGYPEESVIRHVVTVAEQLGIPYDFFDLRAFYQNGLMYFSSSPSHNHWLRCHERRYFLEDYSGIYQRTILPASSNMTSDTWSRMRSCYVGLEVMFRSFSGHVVNRPKSGWENMSKPLQMYWLSQHGFRIPPSLSTSSKSDYQAFRDLGSTIYKSNSGNRSIVGRVENVEGERLQFLEHCPVLFQRQIVGKDVRVHVVQNRVFAVEIDSDAIDYRYASYQGTYRHMRPLIKVPPDIGDLCVSYAEEGGVTLAGFDFKVDLDGNWFCLEMNPTPSFESYDHVHRGQIAECLLSYLLSTS